MGTHGSGARAEGGPGTLKQAGLTSASSAVKPPPDRLYGRARGHALRPRQRRLLEVTLPRLTLRPEQAAHPYGAFSKPPANLWLEIGFGGGEHAVAQIEAAPDAGLIACEVFENGICSLLSRLVSEEGAEASVPLPGNLRVWADDARHLLDLLPAECLDRVFLMFPDPWPKSRHAKRRFVHPEQLGRLARVMRGGAEFRVASDDPTYQLWVSEVMAAQAVFTATLCTRDRPSGWPPTRYEMKALRAGRQPTYWCFART